ncbi:unnamed protein product [Schistosoma curassoni]|uniref:Uncharacterized protein n=1 Tax=Schistosoma curassoni TaxID=6186 RepID=A0A183L6G4_9TREM|nr:unnamed protein product [Schistosoma curassoni]
MALPDKKRILHDTTIYHSHLWGGYQDTLHSNVSQDDHFNYGLSRPDIRQITVNQRAIRQPSNVLNNKTVRRNVSQQFPFGQGGLLGYSPSTQPQLAGACLNYPPSQVQQINPLYQNNDFFGLQKYLVSLALQFAQAIAHMINQT